MATAQKLNDAYQNFLEKDNIEVLLEIVREHTIGQVFAEKKLCHLQEDIAQDVEIFVWRSIDPKCLSPYSQFTGKSSFSTWLSHVINNAILKELRDAEEYEAVGTSRDLSKYTENW